MAKKTSFLPDNFARPAAVQAEAAPAETSRRRNSNAGKYHLGGYFAADNPMVQGFRMLAAKTHRSQQDLLAEAITDLIDKHSAAEAFGK